MARQTLSSILLTSQNYVSDAETSSKTALSDTQTFLKKEINNGMRLIFNRLRMHEIQRVQTASTVADQQFYHKPPDFGTLQVATLTVGGIAYPLEIVDSYNQWNILNETTFTGASIPQFIFVRRDDFGIWPIPANSSDTITLTYNLLQKDLINIDYTDGTVSTTQNDATVTGSGTTFTAGMVGRWFKADSDGEWYRITSFTNSTSIELESVFEGTAVSGDTYIIGESPEIPTELHELLPHFAAAKFYAGPRRDATKAQEQLNYFYTSDFFNTSRRMNNAAGGLLYAVARYAAGGRSNSRLVRKLRSPVSRYDERFRTTLS
ncbi:MAG TPA: hypothetical protein ENI23_09590 [bacterium]|nr:hypothetical protein [bacterium]